MVLTGPLVLRMQSGRISYSSLQDGWRLRVIASEAKVNLVLTFFLLLQRVDDVYNSFVDAKEECSTTKILSSSVIDVRSSLNSDGALTGSKEWENLIVTPYKKSNVSKLTLHRFRIHCEHSQLLLINDVFWAVMHPLEAPIQSIVTQIKGHPTISRLYNCE